MLASVICLPAIAAETTDEPTEEPAAGVVLRLSALKKNGDIEKDEDVDFIQDYTNFEDGWNAAMKYAQSDKMENYDRVVVDFFADWEAADDGTFTDDWFINGTGFSCNTIYIKDDVRVTLNLNGHTIDRDLDEYEHDGEVIYIDEDADVIINDGTITGGWSCNGAGGIHIHDADVVLNNVNVIDNTVEDDDGGAIALYDGAVLTMNGGSIANNLVKSVNVTWVYAAGVYVSNSTASFHNVTFRNNHSGGRTEYERDQSETYSTYGAAIHVNQGTVTIDECKFYDNAHKRGNFLDADSMIFAKNCEMTIKNTIFKGNGDVQHFTNGRFSIYLKVKLIDTYKCDLTIENCQFINNSAFVLLDIDAKSYLDVSNTIFTDNISTVYRCTTPSVTTTTTFTNCTFDRNSISDGSYSFELPTGGNPPTFVDCDLGNSSFNDRSRATIVDSNAADGPGSILGEGSLTMIIALLALVTSAVSIGMTVASNKKKSAPATEDET